MANTNKQFKPTKRNKVFARHGHDCEMPEDPDLIGEYYPGDSWKIRLLRKWLRLILVSEKRSERLHQSHGYLMSERRKHLLEYPFTIHPYSNLRMIWEITMFVVDIVQSVMVPLDCGYFFYLHTFAMTARPEWIRTRLCFDIVCCIDVLMSFNTGYFDEYKKEVILDHKHIALKYAKGMLFFDILTSIPTHWEIFVPSLFPDNLPVLFYMQGIAFLKVLRFLNLDQNFRKLCNIFNLGYYFYQYISLTVQVLLFWHAVSSFVALYKPVGEYVKGRMTSLSEFDRRQPFNAYELFALNCYSGSLIITTTSRVLTIAKPNNKERLFTCVLWVMSKIAQIVLLARILELIKTKKSSSIQYKKKMEQLTEFMRYKKLPLFTQKRLLRYYSHHYQMNYFNEDEIFATVSGQLRQEIAMHSCRKLVENVEFFKDMPFNLLVRVVSCLRTETYMDNDLICKANTIGDSMYFIASGTVAIYTSSGKEICHLEDGDHFGEIALVTENNLRVANAIAIEITEVYRLDRADFIKAIYPYPDLLEHIRKIASQRREETLFLDEHNRRRVATMKMKR